MCSCHTCGGPAQDGKPLTVVFGNDACLQVDAFQTRILLPHNTMVPSLSKCPSPFFTRSDWSGQTMMWRNEACCPPHRLSPLRHHLLSRFHRIFSLLGSLFLPAHFPVILPRQLPSRLPVQETIVIVARQTSRQLTVWDIPPYLLGCKLTTAGASRQRHRNTLPVLNQPDFQAHRRQQLPA